jgi:galactitol-specific phosphotransferase system IIB component
MSHQVQVKTQIKDKAVLEDVLKELGYGINYDRNLIDYWGKSLGKIDISVSINGISDKVGFKLNEAEQYYEIVGDFYGMKTNQETFRNSVKKLYVEKQLKTLLSKKRYNVVSKEVSKNGTVKMLARTMIA